MMLVGDLEELIKRRLSPTLAWDVPTVEKMASFLAEEMTRPAPASQTASAPDDAGLVAMLDQMSEEEIDRLLQQRLGPQ
jgi:hypothetical protein